MTRRWAVNLSGPDSKCVRAKAPDCRNRDWHPPARDEGCRLLPHGTRAHQQFDPPPYRIHRQKPTNHNRQSMAKVRRRSADQRTKYAESDDRNWSYKSACLVTATARATKTESARAKKGYQVWSPFWLWLHAGSRPGLKSQFWTGAKTISASAATFGTAPKRRFFRAWAART